MVRNLVSITVERGKMADARQWAREVAAYVSKTYPVQAQAFAEVFGNVGTIHWTVDHADLASLVQYMERTDADREYQGMVQRGREAGLFVAGSLHNTVMSSI